MKWLTAGLFLLVFLVAALALRYAAYGQLAHPCASTEPCSWVRGLPLDR
jgi:hypothetical protein